MTNPSLVDAHRDLVIAIEAANDQLQRDIEVYNIAVAAALYEFEMNMGLTPGFPQPPILRRQIGRTIRRTPLRDITNLVQNNQDQENRAPQ
jgi:hypothetical protein